MSYLTELALSFNTFEPLWPDMLKDINDVIFSRAPIRILRLKSCNLGDTNKGSDLVDSIKFVKGTVPHRGKFDDVRDEEEAECKNTRSGVDMRPE